MTLSPITAQALANPGIFPDMSNEAYHEHHAISKSGLDLIRRSPFHYWAEKSSDDDDLKRKTTKAMNIGTAFHLLALEPEKFDARIAVAPDLNLSTKIGKETWRVFEEESPGKILLRPADMDGLSEMAKSIRNHAGARYLLQGKGMVEASMFWRESIYGIDCRCRPDWMRDDGLLIDVKTTDNASPEVFDRHFWNMRYHVQGAFYVDGFEAILKAPCPGFAFIVVEKKPPYAVSLRILTAEYVNIGRRAYLEDIETFARCQRENDWPGYGLEVREIHPPAWANNL
jgi:PDDEXK-like domain of unknown function (DUF3799)